MEEEVEILEVPRPTYKKEFESKVPENRKKYNESYYEKNKAKILERATQKKNCEHCNKMISSVNWCKHITTLKHKQNVEIEELKKTKNKTKNKNKTN